MKPPPFEYRRPESLAEAVDLLALVGDEARPLAGGQSLLPLLAMRLARPAMLVDVQRVPELRGIEAGEGVLRSSYAACATPADSGVSDQPSPTYHSGRSTRYQSASFGLVPPMRTGWGTDHLYWTGSAC